MSKWGSILRKIQEQKRAQQQAQQEQVATTPEDVAGVFESKKGAPETSSPATMANATENGLFGNVRKQLFSGGVSAGGGVFSYGNRRKKGGLFNLFG